jgi:hypothetical protein
VLVGHDEHLPPNRQLLSESGYSKQKLRAHSDTYWNKAVNEWAASFTKDFDIMCEAKAKNLASFEFAKFVGNMKQKPA